MLFRFMKVSERSEHSKWSKFVWQKKYTYFLGISAHLRSDDDIYISPDTLKSHYGMGPDFEKQLRCDKTSPKHLEITKNVPIARIQIVSTGKISPNTRLFNSK